MLYLPKFLILLLQLLLVDPIALDLGHRALVVEVVYCTIDFRMEVMVILKELELARGVSAEGSSGGKRGCLERLDILVGVSVYHTIDQGVFAILEFDIFCGLHFAAWETNVEGNIVCTFIQRVPFWDLQSWSIIFPSKPRVSLLPFVSWSISDISSRWCHSSSVAM